MALDADEEILQDFLIEAAEILEILSGQLVDLENSPDDQELLNSIFRGYHTVKGGAGFLGLTPLVDICHIAENVFDLLRNGEQKITSELMDVSLKALDAVNEMFEDIQSGEMPQPAEPEIIEQLGRYSVPLAEMASETEPLEASIATAAETIVGDDEISEDEFDALLNDLHGEGGAPGKALAKDTTPIKSAASDEISEDEFEALLNDLHGEGGAPGNEKSKASSQSSSENSADEITEAEFDALLDELHGSASAATSAKSTPATDATKTAATKKKTSVKANNLITDDEFESLLDDLHGSGGSPSKSEVVKSDKPPAAKSAAKKVPTVKTNAAKPTAAKPTASRSKPATVKPSETIKPKTASGKAKTVATTRPAKKASGRPATESTVRVDTRRLDEIMNMVGELVLVRNRLISLGQAFSDEKLSKAISNLDVVTGELQGAVMKTRMQPIKKVFGRFPRVVRDLARNLKKEISLQLVGEETDLDKNLVEALADPLVHLVRNSVDHGIEMPDIREANGKDRIGMIVLSASQEGDHILLQIEDDGAGMDPAQLKKLAVKKGMMDQEAADRLSESECYNLILQPGFSTKTEVSDISGRGVGMDVVKTKISQLNGSIIIDSVLGKGTTINIKVPLTLAILPTLMVEVGGAIFAFPLGSVNEIFHLDLTKTNIVDGQLAILVREKALPMFYLEQWLTVAEKRKGHKEEGHVVIFQIGTKRVGFVVDALIGQEEVVIKPLGVVLQGTPGMAGATITSDGSIALILDVPSLLGHYT